MKELLELLQKIQQKGLIQYVRHFESGHEIRFEVQDKTHEQIDELAYYLREKFLELDINYQVEQYQAVIDVPYQGRSVKIAGMKSDSRSIVTFHVIERQQGNRKFTMRDISQIDGIPRTAEQEQILRDRIIEKQE